MADWFASLFGQGSAPAPAPAAAAPAAEPPAPAPAPAPPPEPVAPPKPLVTMGEIEAMTPYQVVKTLDEAITTTPDINLELIEGCCRRLRVLCRDPENCKSCDAAGTAAAVVQAMQTLPQEANVQLQALAAVVNLCSGEANEHRKNAVEAGAMMAIIAAMNNLRPNAEVQEMACIALQNCCYGEDDNAVKRRRTAGEHGALEAVITAMKTHSDSAPMQEVGCATLRLVVHRVGDLRQKAIALGAEESWVKPISQGGGILSFRKGFGFSTTRRKNAKNSTTSQSPLPGISESSS